MITIRSLDDRTYEELMAEALAEIPLYTSEWTNFNASDPGITILENLTAFAILQQNHIDQITLAIRRKLLKLLGFYEEKGRCARVFLTAENVREGTELYQNQKLRLGDLCFETNRPIRIEPWKIRKIFSICNGEERDYSFLKEKEVTIPAYIFGENPKEGDSVYFVTDGLPEAEEELIFYFTVADRYNRNPPARKGTSYFAHLSWECYTNEGYKPMKTKDYTGCFLVSGEVRLRIPEGAVPTTAGGREGYVIRATLDMAEYDVRPKLISVVGFLFEAWQKETLSACYTFQRNNHIQVKSDLVKNGYITVLGKEEKGSSYRRYEPAEGEGREGRYYELDYTDEDSFHISFSRKKYKYGPEKLKASVKILLYNEEMMRKYSLGRVLGYDRQVIELPVKNIVSEAFSILAVREDENGEEIYDFVRPGYEKKDMLNYYLDERQGKIIIEDAGSFIGARLYIGGMAVTAGHEGNIRKGNYLKTEGIGKEIVFYNPQEGTEGRFREDIREVEERFLKDLERVYTAVTADDYEKLVMATPELCIHKVRAFMNKDRNMVKIVVKPGTDEPFPQLSEIYRKNILNHLEDKRLLTTKICILNPQYVPVDVHGTIYVNGSSKNSRQEIEAVIYQTVDYLKSDKTFGERLRFEELFQHIQSLDCVEYIYDLHMVSQKPGLARSEEADIVPSEECLCYVGQLYLDIGTYGK